MCPCLPKYMNQVNDGIAFIGHILPITVNFCGQDASRPYSRHDINGDTMRDIVIVFLLMLQGLIYFYVPMQFYAHRLADKAGYTKYSQEYSFVRYLFYSYLIWYTPIVIGLLPFLLEAVDVNASPGRFILAGLVWWFFAYFILEQWWQISPTRDTDETLGQVETTQPTPEAAPPEPTDC